MANLLDYLKDVKDIPLKEQELNVLDKTCINEIGYIPFEKWLTPDQLQGPTRLKDLYDTMEDVSVAYSFLVTKERVQLLTLMLEGQRFADLTIRDYHSDLDKEFEKQFAAMIFSLPQVGYHQLVFRGTDDSVIGWKEDFQLTYSREIPAHRSALKYLKEHLPSLSGPVVLSGHSKGGNLALYAAVHSEKSVREQLADLLLLDSPGLMKEELALPSYEELLPRMQVVRPQDSIVGIMLYWKGQAKIVASEGYGISQHTVTNWQIDGKDDFLKVVQPTELSRRLELTFQGWIEQLPKRELKLVFDVLFDTLLDSGIDSLDDLTLSALPKVRQALQSYGSLSDHEKKTLQKAFNHLVQIFWETGQLTFSVPSLTDSEVLKRLFDTDFNRK